MDRSAYNKCIIPYISGSKPKEQRTLDFCIGAKICSGKAKSEEEAREVCLLPKEPKALKVKAKRDGAKSCERGVIELTQCMMDYFEEKKLYKQILNVNSVGTAIANALVECQCQK